MCSDPDIGGALYFAQFYCVLAARDGEGGENETCRASLYLMNK